jgi:phenylacetic acid degradation protein
MNSVVMDKAVIGDECIIGALAFVPANLDVNQKINCRKSCKNYP